MRHLDIFSGIGGFALAARWAGFETVGFSEIDEFACKVLEKHWPDVPNLGNIKEIKGDECGTVDLVTGGYPCQPFSSIGARRGHEDPRHLWPELFRIIQTAKPAWVVCENVERHVSMGLDTVLDDLEGEGYEARPIIIPACSVGSPQERKRVWVVAHLESFGDIGVMGQSGCKTEKDERRRRQADWRPLRDNTGGTEGGWCGRREPASRIRRVADGIPRKLDKLRIKALGNAIVPQVAYEILKCLGSITCNSLSSGLDYCGTLNEGDRYEN